jgi:hypothetical protein
VLRQRVVDVAGGAGLVVAVTASLGDVDDGPLSDPLQSYLTHDLRVDDRGGHGSRSRAALVAARAGRPASGRGSEEEVAHRASAARGARNFGEDRQTDRQPEAQHERQGDRERREPGPRHEHGARRR